MTVSLPSACSGMNLSPQCITTAQGPIEIALDRAASGNALLALHGGMGGWDQSALLARAALGPQSPWRILAASRPGYLGTPMRAADDLADQADLQAAALDALGVSRAAVIAVSAAGPTALTLALRHPNRVSALVLVSACTGRLAIPLRMRLVLPLLRLMSRIPERPARSADPARIAERLVRDPMQRAALLTNPEALELAVALATSSCRALRARLPGTLADTARFARMAPITLSALQVPVLAIHGTADPVVGFGHGGRVALEAAAARLMRIEGGEHVALFTHMAEIRAQVASFLARHAGSNVPSHKLPQSLSDLVSSLTTPRF